MHVGNMANDAESEFRIVSDKAAQGLTRGLPYWMEAQVRILTVLGMREEACDRALVTRSVVANCFPGLNSNSHCYSPKYSCCYLVQL
jgi:hypothetical protein